MKKGTKDNENIKDPIDPDIVFCGLILVNFFPLNIFPTINPPKSDIMDTRIE